MIILTFETALPIAIFSFIKIAWNLPRWTITLLSLKQFMAQPLSDSKMLTRLFTFLAKLNKVLSLAKLWTDTLHRKKKKLLMKILNKIGPTIEPCGTPDVIVWKLLFI